MLDMLESWRSATHADVNKIALGMSGGPRACAAAHRSRRYRPVAMQIFAFGAIPPREVVVRLLVAAHRVDRVRNRQARERFVMEDAHR